MSSGTAVQLSEHTEALKYREGVNEKPTAGTGILNVPGLFA